MPRSTSPPKDEEIVVAYGFDKVGFSIPPTVESSEYRIECLPYGSDIPTAARGIIFPSGIFEHVEYHGSVRGYQRATVRCDSEILLAVARQVTNLQRAGGWVVILAGEIIDEFPSGDGWNTVRADDTDLAKRLLIGVKKRAYPPGAANVVSKRDEFAPYVKRWGIAKTLFEPRNARVLAVAGSSVVGFEYGARLFVLPFFSTNRSAQHVKDLVQTLVGGVLDYKRKTRVELPAWVGEFQFAGEQDLRREQATLQERLLEVESGLKSWEEYKVILVSSGDILKDALVGVLKDFFALDVDPLDEGREDFKIVDDAKAPIAVGEAKGTNAGVKREHINQVDSHRERLGLGDDVPGLLLINNQMDVAGIEKRQTTQVAPEQVRHARNHNVLVVRTIDLLYLMRHLEADPGKREKFLGLIRDGGGWLSAGPSGYELIAGAGPA